MRNSPTLRKLKPMKSPRTPPTSATRDSRGKASCSFSRTTELLENVMKTTLLLGASATRGLSAI